MTETFQKARSSFAAIAFTLVAYGIVQAFGASAPFSHGDDQMELAFVNGLSSVGRLLGADVFELFRPVKNVLFALFAALGSENVLWCRICAIVVGMISFFPVRAFFGRILENDRVSTAAAAVWLLSPTLVSSTAWLSCVNVQIACALVALAFVCHSVDRRAGTCVAIWFACCSYELAVVAGPALVCFDFFLRPERLRTRRAWTSYVLYAVVTLVYLSLRSALGAASSVNGSFAGTTRADLVFASAYFTGQHFLSWFWPFGRMAVFGGYTRGTVSPAVLVTCWCLWLFLVGTTFALRRRFPAVAFGLALGVVGFLPVGNLLGLGNGPYGDYYLGISSMGFALAGVALAWRALHVRMDNYRLPAFVFLATFVVVRVFAVAEAGRWAYCWADPERAYRSSAATFPKAFYPHVVLARFLCDHGRHEEAQAECAAAETLLPLDAGEQRADVYLIRAVCATVGVKDATAAFDWLDKAERAASRPATLRLCHYYRGCVHEDLRDDLVAAEKEYARALPAAEDWNVDEIRIADRYARVLALRGDLKTAIAAWERAREIAPDDKTVRANLATARRMLQGKKR